MEEPVYEARCHDCPWTFQDPDSLIVLYAAQIHRNAIFEDRLGHAVTIEEVKNPDAS